MALTLEEIMGSSQGGTAGTPAAERGLTLDQIQGKPPEEPTTLDNIKGFLSSPESWKDMGKRSAGMVAAAGDLVAGVPGMAVAVGSGLGARTYAAVTGESRKVQDLASEEGQQLVPEWATQPLQTIVKTLG